MFRKPITKQARRHRRTLIYTFIMALIVIMGGNWLYKNYLNSQHNPHNSVTIATKNFTESFILGNLMADMITAKTHLSVIKKFNLGATSICQAALLRGDIDMYPEYTGTAYITILNKRKFGTPQQVFKTVKTQYEKKFKLTWLPPFGFSNTQALAVRDSFSKKYKLTTISDLIPIQGSLVIGVPAAFKERADGFIGLVKTYGLHFKDVKQMDPGLLYKAIVNKDVNVINAFSTDGRIAAYHLTILKDNKHLYPPYDAAVVIREQTLKQHPQIYKALKPLFGLLDEKTMQQLNYKVDAKHLSPAQVARDFLISKHLISAHN